MPEVLPSQALRRGAGWIPLPALLFLTWLVPGLGHLLLRRRLHAAVFFVVIVVGFVIGVALQGEVIVPHPGDPLSYAAAFAAAGNGILFIAAKLLDIGQGVVTAPSYEFGNTFLLSAGMMNLLLMLDVWDIVVGKKDA